MTYIFQLEIIFLNLYSFRINDRVISANNVSLEGVDYATAVQVKNAINHHFIASLLTNMDCQSE